MVITHKSLKHLFVFAVISLLIHMKPAALQVENENVGVLCIKEERQALLDIKHDLIDSYGFLSSWSSEEHKRDCCTWRGITCSNRTGQVTMLNLNLDEEEEVEVLRGKISHSLFELRRLTYLDLSFIDFEGTQFPTSNVSFAKLRHLDLSFTGLVGNISSMLANLSSLQYLDLSFSNFHDIENVEWLLSLSSLTYLDLSRNHLIKPNNWLHIHNRLPLLETLYLRSCFSGDNIPRTLTPINFTSSLVNIDLSYNHLVFPLVYSWLSNISHHIKSLDLSYNNLEGSTLAVFGNMISLQSLFLTNTGLEGDIPKSFGNMSLLQALYLSDNNFSVQLRDLIQNLSGCTQKSLQFLSMDGNQLTGSLPDLRKFSSLAYLYLGHNRLNGTIEKSIGRLSGLKCLDLGWNSLTGFISEEHLSNMSNLRYLVLSGNFLVWKVSPNWIPPFHLDNIELQSCNMGPHFPIWLQNQHNYSVLDISDNGISDSIPKWFWDLPSDIRYLNLSRNNLSGRVSDLTLEFNLPYPIALDLSFNCLSGPLPFPLISSKLKSSFTSLVRYKFSNGDAVSCPLIYFDLSNNQFSGVLFDRFMNAQDLAFLNLANNNFSGEIPISMGSLFKLETLHLENNALSGELPSSLQNCTRLRFLDVSGNKLSGNIPFWIGESLSSLQFLRLKSNQFHGNIPSQLCQLTKVQILDLSFNDLRGKIPPCFRNLEAMVNANSTATIGLDYIVTLYSIVRSYAASKFYIDKALVLWKGNNYECDKNLGWFRIIDLSSNKIQGEIPRELLSLSALKQLNLSKNKLTGPMPEEIGCLDLESLDLSQNQLSGRLPDSMATLHFLSTLNLSYNNFSGRIPLSTQLQSFDSRAFTGNSALCGLPLTKKCPGDDTIEVEDSQENEEDGEEFMKWVHAGMGVGFSVGFWGVCGTLLLKRSWRHAYFQLLDNLMDWLHVRIAVHRKRLLRKFEFHNSSIQKC